MCKYKSTRHDNLKQHLAFIHDIDVEWFDCDMCNYKCKQRNHLKQHRSFVHDIRMQWHSYAFKEKALRMPDNAMNMATSRKPKCPENAQTVL